MSCAWCQALSLPRAVCVGVGLYDLPLQSMQFDQSVSHAVRIHIATSIEREQVDIA